MCLKMHRPSHNSAGTTHKHCVFGFSPPPIESALHLLRLLLFWLLCRGPWAFYTSTTYFKRSEKIPPTDNGAGRTSTTDRLRRRFFFVR